MGGLRNSFGYYFRDLRMDGVANPLKSVCPSENPIIRSANEGLRPTISALEWSINDRLQIRLATRPPLSNLAKICA